MTEYDTRERFDLQALQPGDTVKTWQGVLEVVPRVDVILGIERGWARPNECCFMEQDFQGFWLCHYNFIDGMKEGSVIGCGLCMRPVTPCHFQWREDERT